MRDLDIGHAGRRGGHVGELHAAGHDALLDDRCPLLFGSLERGVEGRCVGGLHADVVQPGAAAVQKLGVDAFALDGRDELELHFPGVAQRDVGDEVGGLPAIRAGVWSEVDIGQVNPSLDPQQAGQGPLGGGQVMGHPRDLDRCLGVHRLENISGVPR